MISDHWSKTRKRIRNRDNAKIANEWFDRNYYCFWNGAELIHRLIEVLLTQGKTIAVLGSSMEVILYPQQNI